MAGCLTLVSGPMFSGKSSFLLNWSVSKQKVFSSSYYNKHWSAFSVNWGLASNTKQFVIAAASGQNSDRNNFRYNASIV